MSLGKWFHKRPLNHARLITILGFVLAFTKNLFGEKKAFSNLESHMIDKVVIKNLFSILLIFYGHLE